MYETKRSIKPLKLEKDIKIIFFSNYKKHYFFFQLTEECLEGVALPRGNNLTEWFEGSGSGAGSVYGSRFFVLF